MSDSLRARLSAGACGPPLAHQGRAGEVIHVEGIHLQFQINAISVLGARWERGNN